MSVTGTAPGVEAVAVVSSRLRVEVLMFAVASALARLEEIVIGVTLTVAKPTGKEGDDGTLAAAGSGLRGDSSNKGSDVVARDGPRLQVDRIYVVAIAGLEEVVVISAVLIGIATGAT